MRTYRDSMNIRDQFAAAALQGLLANNGEEVERFYYGQKDKDIVPRLAEFAYDIADAMLVAAARYKEEEQP